MSDTTGPHTTGTRTTGPHTTGTDTAGQSAGGCCGVNACCTPDEQAMDAGTTVVQAKTDAGCGCLATDKSTDEATAEAGEADDGEPPVVVIGAGPIGLAAAAHLSERGLPFLVLEAGERAGASVAEWGHVRLFSPWRFNTDAAARRLLDAAGWTAPPADALPTGAELVRDYLTPLAGVPELAGRIRTGTRVIAVTREGIDATRTIGRDEHPLLVRTRDAAGRVRDLRARAVIDASGTWGRTNPLGHSGLPAPGEDQAAASITGPLPDVTGRDRARFAGKHTLVAGMGHSAANTLLALADLAESAPGTRITWAVRGASPARLYGGGDADGLPARGALGSRLQRAVESGAIELIPGFTITGLSTTGLSTTGLAAPGDGPVQVTGTASGGERTLAVDTVVAATGFRPDLDMLREVRVELDPGTESPVKLAPMIDPNFHSCGTVPPHGERELAHPETGFYIAGMKSYGRAPTFLMATGYEQIRSIVAALAGDRAAADSVELDLPETGVCSTDRSAQDEAVEEAGCGSSCSTGPAQEAVQEPVPESAPVVAEEDGSACCDSSAPEPISLGDPVTVGASAGSGVRLGFVTGHEHGYSGDTARGDA
ncbi:FAD-dependent oxidoreductase [Actinomadura sp. 9N407]|uniref:FAD-dependent oxidoreductase n=1 Tax=Actinomadura sp. 9N407 TaxID=3375154 RepID=UPI00378FEDFD